MRLSGLPWICLVACVACLQAADPQNRKDTEAFHSVPCLAEEFFGPFPSWADVRRDYGASGDGRTDDTDSFQRALNDLGQGGKAGVLYIPKGTYRIQRTLTMASHFGVAIVGEDPQTTILQWHGEKGGTLLSRNGVRWTSFSRLGFDGRGVAGCLVRTYWDGKIEGYGTLNEYADCHFRDADFGLRVGVPHFGDAEATILRCRFERCAQAGFSVNSFNSLDLWVIDSLFEDCRFALTNQSFHKPGDEEIIRKEKRTDPEGGAGHFHASNCVFIRSSEADCSIMHGQYFSIRHCLSLGSKAFFLAKRHPMFDDTDRWGAEVLLQGNSIVDAQPGCVSFRTTGPLTLLDNRFKPPAGAQAAPLVLMAAPMEGTVAAVRNILPWDGALSVAGRLIDVGTRVEKPSEMAVGTLELPATPVLISRPTIEVPLGANAARIQQSIDEADKLRGQRPVVHFPAGRYDIDSTLRLPSGSDMQLVGDGYQSSLVWVGPAGSGPVLHLAGPTHATLRDLRIWGGEPRLAGHELSDGVVVDQVDQEGSRVFTRQLKAGGSDQGIWVDRLARTDVDLVSAAPEGRFALTVDGVGENQKGRTAIFGGATSNNERTFRLRGGGRLLVRDTWFEGSAHPAPFLFGSDSSGEFSWSGGLVSVEHRTRKPDNLASITFNGFRGQATILSMILATDGWISIPKTDDFQFLGVGLLGGESHAPVVAADASPEIVQVNSRSSGPSGGSLAPPIGELTPVFLDKMLDLETRTRLRPLGPPQPGITQLTVIRLSIEFARNGLHLTDRALTIDRQP